jgi:hypothetical protein
LRRTPGQLAESLLELARRFERVVSSPGGQSGIGDGFDPRGSACAEQR